MQTYWKYAAPAVRIQLNFIHNVNGDSSKTAKSYKGDITQHHIDIHLFMIFAVFDLSLLTLQLFLVFLGDRFWSPYDIGPLSVLFVTLMHCGQTVGWIKMLLGMEVGLGPGHIVLDRDPAVPK